MEFNSIEEKTSEIDVRAYSSDSEDDDDTSNSILEPDTNKRSLRFLSDHPLSNTSPFLLDCDIEVTIIGFKRDARSHPLNPNLYEIQVKHGSFEWTVSRRYKHFFSLARSFLFQKAKRLSHKREPLGRLPQLPLGIDLGRRRRPAAMNRRLRELERFLKKAVSCPGYCNTREMMNFLEVSRFSFIHDLGGKSKEGLVKKKGGGHRFPKFCRNCSNKCCYACACGFWKKRWLLVKDSFMAYCNPKSRELRSVFLFDQDFSVAHGIEQTGVHHGLRLTNSSRVLMLQAWSKRQALEWRSSIDEKVSGNGKIWTEKHRFDSFAPVREESQAKWFICGSGYFEAVADALESAQKEIFIADWWLTPELHLKRPTHGSDYWRLDIILKRKASQGVKVYISLYKEVELAVSIGSLRAKQYFHALHPNILVLRHPDHDLSGGTFLWAHHEKIVCVDQEIAFVGGMDICFGRWDDSEHQLTDLSPITLDVQDGGATGLAAIVVQSTAVALAAAAPFSSMEMLPSEGSNQSEKGLIDAPPEQIWPGKDYYNPLHKGPDRFDLPFEDVVPRLEVPRMPWQDIGVGVWGRAARDVARHFVQRWNFVKNEKSKERGEYPLLLPCEGDCPRRNLSQFTQCKCQVLRSVGEWSSGVPTEYSILQAYVDCIEKAEHFIYIENQFFITSLPESVDNEIGLALAERVKRAYEEGKQFRIIVVLPLLPEFSGEIGEASGTASHVIIHWNSLSLFRGGDSLVERIQAIDPSLDPKNYFMVFGLRNHGELKSKPITEEIYVHSKMMIVDDKRAIIGSANINDRSMTGRRDSEIAILVEDTVMVDSTMGGHSFKAGKFCQSLRLQLFRNYLGFAPEAPSTSLEDPLSREFFKGLWVSTAAKNSLIYDEVFNCLPSGKAKDFEEVRSIRSSSSLAETDPVTAKEKLKEVKGHLVLMPVNFLADENLLPPLGTAESLVPQTTFT
eukprot:m.48261 g.48261  ORF g.48261 m.48261 type:complete len:960 (+) comp33867_c0_seq7:82-2961(+)